MDEPRHGVGLSDSARMHAIIEGIYAKTPYFKSMPCTIETVAVGRVRVALTLAATFVIIVILPQAVSWQPFVIPYGDGLPDDGFSGYDLGNQYELHSQCQQRRAHYRNRTGSPSRQKYDCRRM
mgnify:CR=1 FL=1